MRVLSAILTLLIFATGAFAGDLTLVKRHEGNANTYVKANGTRVLEIGGVYNHLPFEGGDKYQETHLIHSQTESIGAGFVRHRNGPTRIDVNLNAGTVRYYPIRGSPNKYIEIKDPVPPNPFIVNQINDYTVEYYADYSAWRLTFLINDLGVKTLITVNETYTGDGSFTLGFRTVGLTLDGQNVMDGESVILTMPKAFLYDAESTIREVVEVYDNNTVTLSADLTGLVHPIVYDPTLGPDNPVADSFFREDLPNNNLGGNTTIQLRNASGVSQRSMLRFDLSSIPTSNIIVSANLYLEKTNTVADGLGADFHLFDVGRESWPELQVTWNNYATATAWTTAGGDYNATPYLTTALGSTGAWNTDHKSGVTTAVKDRVGVFSTLLKFNVEQTGAEVVSFRSMEYGTAAQRPTLTVEYTFPRTHLGYPNMVDFRF